MSDDTHPASQSDATDRRRSSDIVLDELREAIRTNQLTAGEQLSQVALARQFGVSRIPVREALRQLAAEGFVVWEPGEMVTVSRLDDRLLHEVVQLRTLLERWLVDRAVDRIDDVAVSSLEELIDRMATTDEPIEWRRLNDRFHGLLHECADSLVAIDLVERLGNQADRFLDVPVDDDEDRRRHADAEHREIVAALRADDRAAARRLLDDHLAHRLGRLDELLGGRADAAETAAE